MFFDLTIFQGPNKILVLILTKKKQLFIYFSEWYEIKANNATDIMQRLLIFSLTLSVINTY